MKKVRSPAVLPKKKSEPFAVFQYSNFTSKQASYTESAAEKGKNECDRNGKLEGGPRRKNRAAGELAAALRHDDVTQV